MSIIQNDTSPILFYMTLSSDHVSPATGKTVSVTLSKNGAAFAAGGGTVAELSNGWYKYTPVTADVGTLGDLGIRATATSCDDWNDVVRVVQAGPTAADYTTARAGKLDYLTATVPTAAQNADALLARNQKGGADGPSGQTVADALAGGLMDIVISGTTLTVKNGDGTTAYTRTLTRDATLQIGAILAAA